MSEHDEQVKVFQWRDLNIEYNKIIDIKDALKMLYAIPNGAMFPKKQNKDGQSYSSVAKKMKDEGLTAGIPDISLDYTVWNLDSLDLKIHGLKIEMKYRPQPFSDKLQALHDKEEYLIDLSKEQKEYRQLFLDQGYDYVICYSGAEAIQRIINYLDDFKTSDYLGLKEFGV